jgi:Fe-S-cluster containining protein
LTLREQEIKMTAEYINNRKCLAIIEVQAEYGVSKHRKHFIFRRVTDLMPRNAPCFCGSGKKKKHCHPDVHDDSIAANLLAVFARLDAESAKLARTPCHAGCNDCCYDYFNISIVEFFAIADFLNVKSQAGIPLKYCNAARAAIRDVVFPADGDDTHNLPKYPRCIFVNDVSGECDVYEARPAICRLYGADKTITKCPKILCDAEFEGCLRTSETDTVTVIDRFPLENGTTLEVVPKPIIYWFSSRIGERGQLLGARDRDLLEAYAATPAAEFLRIIRIP